MLTNLKLRTPFSLTGYIPAMICIMSGLLALILFGPREGIATVGVFFILYAFFSLWILYHTGNLSYIAAALFQLFFGLYILTSPKFQLIKVTDPVIPSLLLVICIISTVWLLYYVYTRKAKWKGRELFELASAAAINDPDGFTERPKPVGRAEYTDNELKEFALYLKRNLIAMPYYESDRIVLVPVKMDDSFAFLFNPGGFRNNRSWVAFDFNGNVTVYISRKDYLSFKEEVSFDQLCSNLGNLFIRFAAYFRKGEAERILNELNDIGLGFTN